MTILKEADDLINGERQKQYDHPSEDFAFQGRVLGAMVERYLRKHVKGMENARVPAFPGWFMGLLAANCEKASHAIADPDHRDSWVDGVGYWGAGWKAMKTPPIEVDLGPYRTNEECFEVLHRKRRTQADSPGEGWFGGPGEALSIEPLFVGGRADHPDWEAAQKMTKDNTTPQDMGRPRGYDDVMKAVDAFERATAERAGGILIKEKPSWAINGAKQPWGFGATLYTIAGIPVSFNGAMKDDIVVLSTKDYEAYLRHAQEDIMGVAPTEGE